MEARDKDLEAGSAKPEVTAGAGDMSWSPTGSSTDVDEKRRHNEDYQQDAGDTGDIGDAEKITMRKSVLQNDAASRYSGESFDHGEPDLEHEEMEEAVPGHELDRQLSRVSRVTSKRKPRQLHGLPLTLPSIFLL